MDIDGVESKEAVKRAFFKHAANRYADTIYDIKKKWTAKKQKDKNMSDAIFKEWVKL